MRFREDGPAIFGKPGCYEGYASANALGLLLSYRRPKDFPLATPVQVIDEVRHDNPNAKWALTQNERAVGSACAMLADLLAVNADACVVRAAMPDLQDRSALAAALDADEQKAWRKR